MIPVYQRTGAKAGEPGDCFQACLASILNMKLHDVPNFNIGAKNGQALPAASSEFLRTWLVPHGRAYVEFGFHLPRLADMLENMNNVMPYNQYFLVGRTNTYRIHCVIASGGAVVHDPAAPVGVNSIVGPCHDGFWRVGLFIAC